MIRPTRADSASDHASRPLRSPRFPPKSPAARALGPRYKSIRGRYRPRIKCRKFAEDGSELIRRVIDDIGTQTHDVSGCRAGGREHLLEIRERLASLHNEISRAHDVALFVPGDLTCQMQRVAPLLPDGMGKSKLYAVVQTGWIDSLGAHNALLVCG